MAANETKTKTKPPTKYGVALFPGFQALDVFGPLDTLNNLSRQTPLEFVTLAATLDPVCTSVEGVGPRQGQGCIGQTVLPTHTFDGCPDDLEVLLGELILSFGKGAG